MDMTRRNWTIAFMATLVLSVSGQTAKRDTTITTVRIGYSDDNQNTIAGAIDKVTEERMNKGLMTSSLDALSGQAAGVQVSSGANQEAMVSAVRVRGNTSLTGGNDPLVGMPYIDKGYDTDFTNSIERTGFVQNHHIAFGGGSESANYRASIGMMDHRTILRNYLALNHHCVQNKGY